ncbi:MAG: hypothetical protein D6705_04215 [Deltaproteobacteria bacterium]|nr:MAG: hypothetical protein D6705_04215 [Deltaproteobacteria bacterium]
MTRRAGATLALLVSACAARSAPPEVPGRGHVASHVRPTGEPAASTSCVAPPSSLGRVEHVAYGESCADVVVRTPDGIALWSGEVAAVVCRGPVPPCPRCRFVDATMQPPALWAIRRGPLDAAPREVWLGLCDGGSLGWIDAWAGQPASSARPGDRRGPDWTLAPERCGDRWVLRMAPRFDLAPGSGPGPRAKALEGPVRVRDGALVPDADAQVGDACTRASQVPP